MFTGSSKELMRVRMNESRSKVLMGCGTVILIIALLVFWFFASNQRQISRQDAEGWFILIIVLLAEYGISSILNGVALKEVCLVVYDEGIYGVCANINAFCGFFTKTIPFDVPFSDITSMRCENRTRLLIQTRYKDYSFVFTTYEVQQVMELLEKKIGK